MTTLKLTVLYSYKTHKAASNLAHDLNNRFIDGENAHLACWVLPREGLFHVVRPHTVNDERGPFPTVEVTA